MADPPPDDPAPASAAASKPAPRAVRVGLPGGTVHEFTVDASALVSDVVALVMEAESLEPSAVHVRIISSGKLVRDHTTPLSDVLNEGSFLHAAVSEARPEREAVAGDAEVPLVVSAVDADGEVRILIPELTSRGFERLAEAGFSEEEIRMIRRQFRVLRREARVRGEEEGGEEQEGERGDGEGEWVRGEEAVRLRRSDTRSVLSWGVEGSNGDFLMGCIFGYLLGIIVLVLLLDNNATRRWRVGIVAGVATNCAFGILRTSLYLQEPFAAP